MNTILLFLSKDRLKEDGVLPNDRFYKYGVKTYRGIQTNDAPVRALMDQKDRIDQIIVITTKEVLNDRVVNDMTTLERFEMMVGDEAGLHGYDAPRIISVPYDNTEIEDARESALRIYQDITKYLDGSREQRVMIDFTGGMRDVNFLMTTIIRYLQVAGISCERIVYSNQNPPRIVNLDYIYDMFQQVNAVNEFVTTGNATELGKIYKGSGKVISNVIEAIQNFSDTVLMCSSGHIDDAISQLAEAVSVEIDGDTFESGLFKTLIPIIKKKMHLESGKMEYPDLIRWCLDNRMIQQAVTFYIEKMPVYYFEHGMMPAEVDLEQARENRSAMAASVETQAFYTDLFDIAGADLNLKGFKEIISGICDDIPSEEDPFEKYYQIMHQVDHHIRNSSGLIKQALNRLKEFIRKTYDNISGVKKYGVRAEIYGAQITQKDADKFMRYLENNAKFQHYFLYDDPEAYERIRSAGTYQQKIIAIDNLLSGKRTYSTHPEVVNKMEYYVAVKLLRNRMNHASGGEQTDDVGREEDEKYAIEYLGRKGITISENPTVNDAINILRQGIELDNAGGIYE